MKTGIYGGALNYKAVMCIGVILSLLYDVFQIYLSWDNQILSLIGIASLCVALYGLGQNLSGDEEFKIGWMKYYIIPLSIAIFGLLSVVDDVHMKVFGIAGISSERAMPGETIDYVLSLDALLFSYVLPFITLGIYWASMILYELVKLLQLAIEKVFEL